MRILDRYILKGFLLTWVIAFVCMVGLWIVADLMLNIDEFTKGNPDGAVLMSRMFRYYSYQMLEYFRHLAALITVVAATFTLARLQHNNELAPILAGGTSAHRVILPIIVGGLGFLMLNVVVQEVCIPACRDQLNRDREFDGVDPSFRVSLLEEGPYYLESGAVHPHRRQLSAAEVIDLLYGSREMPPPLPTPPPTTRPGVDKPAEIRRPEVRVVLPRKYRGRKVLITPHHTNHNEFALLLKVGRIGVDDRDAAWRIDVARQSPLSASELKALEDFRNVVVVTTMPGRKPVAINLLDDNGRFSTLPLMNQPRLIIRDDKGRYERCYSAVAGVWWDGNGPEDPSRRWHWDRLALAEDLDKMAASLAMPVPAADEAAAESRPAFVAQANLPVPLTLPPDELELRSNSQWLNLLSLWELVRRAESEGYRDAQIYSILHFRFSTWFFSVILLLLGMPLLMNVDRTNLFISGMYATGITVFPFVVHFVLQQMAVSLDFSGMLTAAWLPIFVFGGLAGWLLQSVRT